MPSATSTSAAGSYPRLLSLAVHELRTPASIVGGYLRMLQHDTTAPLDDRQAKMIAEAAKSCGRLVEIIAELSDVGKFDAGVFALSLQPLDVFQLVGELAGHLHEGADRGVGFEVRGETSGAPMTGDAVRLRAAFTAVFRAILREKAGPCTVVADCRRDEVDGRSSAVVVVAERDRVQEAYARPRAGFDDYRGGLGLLLPLARRIIDAHGGQLWAPASDAAGEDVLERSAAVIALPIA